MGTGASTQNHGSLTSAEIKQIIIDQFGNEYYDLAAKLQDHGLDGARMSSSYRRQDMKQLLEKCGATDEQVTNLLYALSLITDREDYFIWKQRMETN